MWSPALVVVCWFGGFGVDTATVIQISPEPGRPSVEHLTYLAYAPNGTVQGDLVYANYGNEDDFQTLAQHNISVKGRIVIIRSRNVRI